MARLAAFAGVTLKPDAPEQDYRLARKAVIEAIAALSNSAGRMSVEPVAARKGLDEMAALLIAAHGLIAQLSAARLDARAGGPPPDEKTRAWLQARLAPKAGGAEGPGSDSPRPLAAATLAVVEAAERYQRAARDRGRGPVIADRRKLPAGSGQFHSGRRSPYILWRRLA